LILFVFFGYLLTPDPNRTVKLLPRDIKKHYLQFSRSKINWEQKGKDASISFLKKLEPNQKAFSKMLNLWKQMDGENIQIESAFAVHSPNQLISFANKWAATTTQVKNNPKLFISQKWRDQNNNEETRLRIWVHEQYKNKVNMCRWNKGLEVPIIPALHGTDVTVAYSIITTSFVALAKGDVGYYGKGLYFTTSAEYALPYYSPKASPAVLICYVITGNAYPVIEHPREDDSLMGLALIPNFHSHYVVCRLDGYPVPNIIQNDDEEDKFYDEIVIEQESNVVPFYLLKIAKECLGPLIIINQEKQDKLFAKITTDDNSLEGTSSYELIPNNRVNDINSSSVSESNSLLHSDKTVE